MQGHLKSLISLAVYFYFLVLLFVCSFRFLFNFYLINWFFMYLLRRIIFIKFFNKSTIANTFMWSASDDCVVGDYGEWGECTGAVCGATGKQYRQRSYKYPDKAIKCHRKLFDTKKCIMPRCTHGTNHYLMHVHPNL